MRTLRILTTIAFVIFVTNMAKAQSYVTSSEVYSSSDLVEITATQQVTLENGFHATEGSNVHVFIDPYTNNDNITYTPTTGNNPSGTPSSTQNYIRSISMRQATTGTSTSTLARIDNIQYFDGLGRLAQSVTIDAVPGGGADIVVPVDYDDFGRKTGDYLPYADDSNNGAYVSDAISDCINYYSTDNIEGRTNDSRPYSAIKYENSPLNRVLGDTTVGYSWSGYPTIISYSTNTSPVSSCDENGAPINYAANQLFLTTYIDENLHQVREYIDKLGKVVLKEAYDGLFWLKTHYIYDDLGLLRKVIPPEASSPIDPSHVYTYTYDERKRMVEKQLPGAATVYMVYDARDRLVMTLDGNMDANDKWLATVYDQLNRPVITALVGNNNIPSAMESLFEDFSSSASKPGTIFGYNVPAQYGISESDVQTVIYYDDYSFVSQFGSGYTYDSPYLANNPASNSNDVKSFVTGTLERVIEGGVADNLLLNVNYYDDYGRIIRTVSDNHMGGKDILYTDFNFAGEPEEVILRHNVTSSMVEDIKLTTTYAYDHQGRLLTEKMQVDDGDLITIASNKYNDLSEIVTKFMHGNNSNEYFNQEVDYSYNIKGWLKGINSINNLDDDLFSFDLRYNDPQFDGIQSGTYYNGNISEMKWQTANDQVTKGFGFTYDGLNRLIDADFGSGSYYSDNGNDFNTSYSYYNNGNINTLSRYKDNHLIDQLTYSYNGNQLTSVTDNGDTGYKDQGYKAISNTYYYDDNGNMTNDPSKGTSITYNYLNLPSYVDFTSDNISYYYTANGTKVRKDVDGDNSENDVTVDYVGPFLYENSELKCIFTSEGRIVRFNMNGNTSYKYEYNLKDHLGNTRVVFAGHSTGQPEVMQVTDYYPFGLVMEQENYFAEAEMENDYLYNGKELQNDELSGASLDWYDYGARFYDPQLGRWHVIDNKAEKYTTTSPYTYALNNPIIFLDPDGNEVKVALNIQNTTSYKVFSRTQLGMALDSRFRTGAMKDQTLSIGISGQGGFGAYVVNGNNRIHISKVTAEQLKGDYKFEFSISTTAGTQDFGEGAEILGHEAFLHGLKTIDGVQKFIERGVNGEELAKALNILGVESQIFYNGKMISPVTGSGGADHAKILTGEDTYLQEYVKQAVGVAEKEYVKKSIQKKYDDDKEAYENDEWVKWQSEQ